jgi:hypothetical protein
MFDVQAALTEVQARSDREIEIETAYKWGSRAIACYLLYMQSKDMRWLLRAKSFQDEAIEHAAMAEDLGATLKTIESMIGQVRERAAR